MLSRSQREVGTHVGSWRAAEYVSVAKLVGRRQQQEKYSTYSIVSTVAKSKSCSDTDTKL